MIYIAFLQHQGLEKKKKIDLPTLPVFRPKEQTNLYFFRPYVMACKMKPCWKIDKLPVHNNILIQFFEIVAGCDGLYRLAES